MTTESNQSHMMEIPVSEFELLVQSCNAWREWADSIHDGLTLPDDTAPIARWVVDSWFKPGIQPQTDNNGILLKLPDWFG